MKIIVLLILLGIMSSVSAAIGGGLYYYFEHVKDAEDEEENFKNMCSNIDSILPTQIENSEKTSIEFKERIPEMHIETC